MAVNGKRTFPVGVLRVLLVIFIVIPGILILRPVLGLLLGAIFLAFILNPLVELIQSKGASRQAAALTSYLLLVIALFVILAVVIPILTNEARRAAEAFPRLAADIQKRLAAFEIWFGRLRLPVSLNLREALQAALQRLQTQLESMITRLAVSIPGFFSQLVTYFLAPILAYYISRDYPTVARQVMRLVPVKHRDDFQRISTEINHALSNYLRGQLTVGLFVGVLVAIGLVLLNVEFALLIGFGAAIFNVIPYFGPVIAAVPAVLLALRQSVWTPLYVIIIFVVINQLESAVLGPRILGRRVGLHPFVVILAVLIGGKLFGIWGLLGAVPVVVMIKIILPYLWWRTSDDSEKGLLRPVLTTVAVYEGDQIWLVQTANGWHLPTATVAKGETPVAAGKRAAEESLGFQIDLDLDRPQQITEDDSATRYLFVGRPHEDSREAKAGAKLFAAVEAVLALEGASEE